MTLTVLVSRTLSPGLCETYRGQACAEYIGNQSVWVHYLGHQQTVDGELGIILSVIKTNDHMSARYDPDWTKSKAPNLWASSLMHFK